MIDTFLSSQVGFGTIPSILAVVIFVFSFLAVCWFWLKNHGYWLGSAISLCRLVWAVPLLTLLFFVEEKKSVDSELTDKKVEVLIDDSDSMQGSKTKKRFVERVMASLEKKASESGYTLEQTKLSDLSKRTSHTDLQLFREQLSQSEASKPWVLLSDGGAADLEFAYSGEQAPAGIRSSGLVVGVPSKAAKNTWIQKVEPVGFVFEQEGFSLHVTVGRSADAPAQTQVHIKSGTDFLGSGVAQFAVGEVFTTVRVQVKQLPRGVHSLQVQVPALGGELQTADNQAFVNVESLTNTLGVLHLLGEPSWDGRFMRKFLKDEPKFDRISFFILRDPQDRVQAADEELSLIPFPAERLFTKELPNFQLLVIQNFDMQRFLRPNYQENLVKFVENGGSLLFAGGPRALQKQALSSGPLRKILPFSAEDIQGSKSKSRRSGAIASNDLSSFMSRRSTGVTFDESLDFSVGLAGQKSQSPATAILLQNLRKDFAILQNTQGWQGMHRLASGIEMKHGGEVLLNAKTSGGRESPLLIANYPGKGRALWLLSDSSWRTAFASTDSSGPHTYSRFMRTLVGWLLKSRTHERLAIAKATMVDLGDKTLRLEALLTGYQASEITGKKTDWDSQWSVCGTGIPQSKLQIRQSSNGHAHIKANLSKNGLSEQGCTLRLRATSPRSEHVSSEFPVHFAKLRSDKEIVGSEKVLTALGESLGAELLLPELDENARQSQLSAWMDENLIAAQKNPQANERVEKKFFWFFDFPFAWAFFIAFPLEVLLRRKQQIGW